MGDTGVAGCLRRGGWAVCGWRNLKELRVWGVGGQEGAEVSLVVVRTGLGMDGRL